MPKGTLSIIGFLLLLLGFLSIILGMIGLQISYLTFIDSAGKLWGFLIKIIMIIMGIILMYVDQSRFDDEEE